MAYVGYYGWDAALYIRHQEHKDAQEIKERARADYEMKLWRIKQRLTYGLYGNWTNRTTPMWLITPDEHKQLADLVRSWSSWAQVEFDRRFTFLREFQGAYPHTLASSSPYLGQIKRLNHLRMEMSFTQERAIGHLLYLLHFSLEAEWRMSLPCTGPRSRHSRTGRISWSACPSKKLPALMEASSCRE